MRRDVEGSDGDLAELLARQDGVLSRQQTLCVLSDAGLRQRIRSGCWVKPHRGIYVTHNGPLDRRERQ